MTSSGVEQAPPEVTPTEKTRWVSPLAPRQQMVFLYAGLLFLLVAVGLFVLGAWTIYATTVHAPKGVNIGLEMPYVAEGQPSPSLGERERYNFYGQILSIYLGPLFMFMSAAVCSFLGIKLLKSAGAVQANVIPPQDYELLSGAVKAADDKAISEYVRLSALSGVTGTFTKVGLTGLPLATIFLTVLLAVLGIFLPKLLDLAQLTLGAFIGSYVQKKQEPALPG